MSIIFLFILLGISTVNAPNEQLFEAAVTSTVTLSCQTDQSGGIVIWRHYPVGAILSNIVYLNGEVFDNYRGRFMVTAGRFGVFSLTILSVGLEDSGKYTCTTGTQVQSVELIVLELYPSSQSCSSNSSGRNIIGNNSCRIEPDVVSLNCTLRYQGNFQPVLEWRSSMGSLITPKLKAIDDKTTVSTLILKADEQNSATYSCFVKYLNASLASMFSCSLEIIITTLISETREYNADCSKTSVQCLINTTSKCSFTWINDKLEKIGSDLDLRNLPDGQYICLADCRIHMRHNCTLLLEKVNITCGKDNISSISGALTAGIAGSVVLIVLIIAIALILVFMRRTAWFSKTSAVTKDSQEDRTGNSPTVASDQSPPEDGNKGEEIEKLLETKVDEEQKDSHEDRPEIPPAVASDQSLPEDEKKGEELKKLLETNGDEEPKAPISRFDDQNEANI